MEIKITENPALWSGISITLATRRTRLCHERFVDWVCAGSGFGKNVTGQTEASAGAIVHIGKLMGLQHIAESGADLPTAVVPTAMGAPTSSGAAGAGFSRLLGNCAVDTQIPQ